MFSYTAGAGHQLYTARAFPKRYWNRIAFINEPTAHLVGQGIIELRGAGFVTRDGWNLLAGAEEWVAPVQAQVGLRRRGVVGLAQLHRPAQPDAAEFQQRRGQRLRDVDARRVARTHLPGGASRRAAPEEAVALEGQPAGLVSALSSDNMLWRLHAQRLLVERGQKDVVPQLIALVRNKSVDEIGERRGPARPVDAPWPRRVVEPQHRVGETRPSKR